MDLNSLRRPTVLLKFIEIGLLIIIMALYFSQSDYITIYYHTWSQFVASVIVGAFINALALLVVLLLGYDQIQKTPLEIILCFYYILTFTVSAILLFTSNVGPWIGAGFFCLMLAAAYWGDGNFTFIIFQGRPAPFFPFSSLAPSETSADQLDQNRGGMDNIGYQSGQQSTMPSPHNIGPPYTIGQDVPPQANSFQTNPVYPEAMNFPPFNPKYASAQPSMPAP